jgi:hypothetical protein
VSYEFIVDSDTFIYGVIIFFIIAFGIFIYGWAKKFAILNNIETEIIGRKNTTINMSAFRVERF